MTKLDAQQQPLSIFLPPVSTVTMNETSLELTDTIKKPVQSTTAIQYDCSEDAENMSKKRSFKITLFFKRYVKLWMLVFRSIIPDLKSFKLWQIAILLLFATFNVVFSVLDFNSFFPQGSKLSLLKWTNNAGEPLWRRILLCLSGVAAFTNVLNVVLVIRGKISSFFWGILGAILYGAFAFGYNYVGDAQLYILFFLPMQFVGIYLWAKELDTQSTTRVRSLGVIAWILVILLCVGLGFLFFYEIPAFSKVITSQYGFEDKLVPHILDGSTNAVSVVAQFLLIFCYWEQYILWIGVNMMGIVMYSGLFQTTFDINFLVVWVMFILNSLVGLYTWFRRWKYANRTVRLN